MKRVEVDFGTTVRGGLIRASLRRFPDQTVVRGEAVEAFDDDEGISFTGVVEEVDDRFAYLRMHWSDRPDVPSCSAGLNLFLDANSLAVAVAAACSANEPGPLHRLSPSPVMVPLPDRHFVDA